MPMAEHAVTIARAPDEVFAFLADGTNDPRWRPAVADVAHESGTGVGARYRQGMKGPMGRRVPADFEITEHEPPRTRAFQVTAGPVRPRGRYELAPADGGTSVRFRLECELSGPKKLMMSRPVQKSMDSEVHNLERLKQVLESG
jgi:uncharacterized protein YndB with AHSA1/START domain